MRGMEGAGPRASSMHFSRRHRRGGATYVLSRRVLPFLPSFLPPWCPEAIKTPHLSCSPLARNAVSMAVRKGERGTSKPRRKRNKRAVAPSALRRNSESGFPSCRGCVGSQPLLSSAFRRPFTLSPVISSPSRSVLSHRGGSAADNLSHIRLATRSVRVCSSSPPPAPCARP